MKVYIPVYENGRRAVVVETTKAVFHRDPNGYTTVISDGICYSGGALYATHDDAMRSWNRDFMSAVTRLSPRELTWAYYHNAITGETRRAPRVKLVSVNNGESYCTPEEAVKSVDWDALVSLMDDRTREAVAADWDGDDDDRAGFLRAYLALAPYDLIIG